MKNTKIIFVTGFALFSMFFGAGNLILPPFLGFQGGHSWFWLIVGFGLTAVIIPIFGIAGHAKLQGTMYHFGEKVSRNFSIIYCLFVYTIAITLPIPRTASVTHEMSVAPFFEVSTLVTTTVYFLLVLVFVLNRSSVISIIGKYLTPIIGIILLSVIVIGTYMAPGISNESSMNTPIVTGLLEGYQTFDAIGALVAGGVIVAALNRLGTYNYEERKDIIKKSGFIAGIGLLLIYGGMIYVGALFNEQIPSDASRAEVLTFLSTTTLGSIGNLFLAILVALACFTTAVGVIVGVSDFIKDYFKNKKRAYTITAVVGCTLGILIGQLGVGPIITIAEPVLMLLYPITIVLIMLNILQDRLATKKVFRTVVITAILFSIPDALNIIFPGMGLGFYFENVPFATYSLGWVLPSFLIFMIVNVRNFKKGN